MSFNLSCILEESAAAFPDLPLIYFGEEEVTFAEVDNRASRVASGLMACGLHAGDRVLVQLPNIPEFLYAYFGILKAGLIMVPVNPLLARPEIAYQATDSRARLLITHTDTAHVARDATAQIKVPVLVVGAPSGADDVFDTLLNSPPLNDSAPTRADDTAVLLYTSGTTGTPKGAELTHFQLYMNCTVAGDLFGMGPDDKMTAVLPLFHVFGLSSVLNIAVRFGVGMVLISKFDAIEVLNAVERHRITVFSGVPTMYTALTQADLGGRDVSSLRMGVSGGAAIPAEVIRAFENAYIGVVILEGYGLSETASVATFNLDANQRKVASIGKPIWGIQMRVVNPDGDELPTGSENIGEIVIKGHNVMKGYFNQDVATTQSIRNGWFHTGDLGYRDDDGYYYIADRLKDLIIRGGYNVYPREVEEVLYAHANVAEAAVVGRPEQRLGEEVVAYVVAKPGKSIDIRELDAYCREQLAAYKFPREFHILQELPKGATGKILKRALE